MVLLKLISAITLSKLPTVKTKAKIYHNPRCSKSRQALALLKEQGVDVNVVNYLNEPPSIKELRIICTTLKIHPLEITRTKEDLFKKLKLSIDDKRSDDAWYKILKENPTLIERPIVIHRGKVALGRPPENILKIL